MTSSEIVPLDLQGDLRFISPNDYARNNELKFDVPMEQDGPVDVYHNPLPN